MAKPYYLTTPLYYVNASPHIGHSYTEIAADCLARYHRLKGEEVFFLTGTDEHGEKISQAAAAKGVPVKMFVDQAAETFKALWWALGISYDHFIRTTDPNHKRIVQTALQQLANQLEPGTYTFWYCVPCETRWTASDLADLEHPICPTCQRPVSQVEEQNYYLNLEQHRGWLKQYLAEHETFILPPERRNEILALLDQPLPDLCITRPKERVPWGIPVPFNPEHTTYVWFDALINYISALGWPEDPRFARYWDEAGAIHLIGKDILRHHALYWPIILHALGVRPPKMIFAHGWWKIGEQKMSKSLGNIVDPHVVIAVLLKDQPFAADVYRYFLLREVPFGQDGAFSEEALMIRLQADLANDLGNLVHRTLSMIKRYCQGSLPAAGPVGCAGDDEPLRQKALALSARLSAALDELNFSAALEAIFQLVTHANRYIEGQAPWQLAKAADPRRLQTVLSVLAEVLRIVAISLEPFMPAVSTAIWQQLGMGDAPRRLSDATQWTGLSSGQALGKREVLFPMSTR